MFILMGKALLFIVLVVYIYLVGIGYDPGFTGVILDANSKPVPNAFVVYSYKGGGGLGSGLLYSGEGAVHSGGIVMSDRSGAFTIPSAWHAFNPLLQTTPDLKCEFIYAPAIHSGRVGHPMNDRWGRAPLVVYPSEGRIGQPLKIGILSHTYVLQDLSSDSNAWHTNLDLAVDAANYIFRGRHGGNNSYARCEAAPELKSSYVSELRSELAMFLDLYGNLPHMLAGNPTDPWARLITLKVDTLAKYESAGL